MSKKCSFCDKTRDQTYLLISGNGGALICDECIRLSYEIVISRGEKMNIPESDPKAAIIFCSKCAIACAIAVIPFPGTLVAAVCPHCIRELLKEAEE